MPWAGAASIGHLLVTVFIKNTRQVGAVVRQNRSQPGSGCRPSPAAGSSGRGPPGKRGRWVHRPQGGMTLSGPSGRFFLTAYSALGCSSGQRTITSASTSSVGHQCIMYFLCKGTSGGLSRMQGHALRVSVKISTPAWPGSIFPENLASVAPSCPTFIGSPSYGPTEDADVIVLFLLTL